jgi:hypothetical protein
MAIDMIDKYPIEMECEELLSPSRAKFRMLKEDKYHPFKDDDKLRAALKYLSDLLDFQEGLRCNLYVEKAYEANNGFPTNLKLERKLDMCPGCLGPTGERLAVDKQKTWCVRICDACKRDNPGSNSVYRGQGSKKGVVAANCTDD